MGKTVAISQSNYIPWKGYFDLINGADEFVLLDDVQYTRRDWRNRNKIKSPAGLKWLTIPVQVKGRYDQRIDETVVADHDWPRSHWDSICQTYRDAPHFGDYADCLEQLYSRAAGADRLSDVNRHFIEAVCELLGIDTRLSWSSEYETRDDPTERLLDICTALGASEYVSGPAAKDYLDEEAFAAHGVAVGWMDYSGYRNYGQPYPPFEHHVSVIDLLLCTGPAAREHMKSFAAAI